MSAAGRATNANREQAKTPAAAPTSDPAGTTAAAVTGSAVSAAVHGPQQAAGSTDTSRTATAIGIVREIPERANADAAPRQEPPAANGNVAITETIRRQAAALRSSLAFTQLVGVLMRSPHYKSFTLGDLEWLVLPPLLAGQFRIGEAKPQDQGAALPVAVVLWACVSPEVDKRLMEADSLAVRLQPDEWTSGDIVWLLHAAGETRFVRYVVKQLSETTLKGREIKVFGRDQDGKPKIHLLNGAPKQPA